MTDSGSRRAKWVICLLLGVAVLAAFWPALHCGFVSFDDPLYVVSNPHVQQGLTWAGLKWALTTGDASNWHPMTWISHMADAQFYGVKPFGHHLTSLLLHAVNAILLFLLLDHLTGALWPSAWVAAMFALHPLRVESVAWVSERKDVLCAFFCILAIGAYVHYARSLQSPRRKFLYALALVFFALGLMAKPMIVTLPFVLLLLDYWPLGRLPFGPCFSWRVVAEKAPFLALATGDCVVTFLVQNRFGAVANLSALPFAARLANAPVACVKYIGKDFWPAGLAVFYPHRTLAPLEIAGSVCLLAAVSAWALWRGRAQPYLAVGWFWFLGMLFPVLGLVQAGYQSMADRFTYLPCVGLWIMVAWGVRNLRLCMAAPVAGVAAIAACFVLTPRQTAFWQDTGSLFARDVEVTGPNYMACYNLGCYEMDQGQYNQAIDDFKEALRPGQNDGLSASHELAYNNLGYVYLQQGQVSNAVASFELALKLNPRYSPAYFNMGRAFLTNNQPDVAVDCFQRTLALDSNASQNPAVLATLAAAYAKTGRLSEAVASAQQARQLALAQNNSTLAATLASQLRRYQGGGGGSNP